MSRSLVCSFLVVLVLPASSLGSGPPLVRTDHLGDPLPPGAIARLGTLRFWHGETITAVAISPDGRTVASGSQERESVSRIQFWEAKSGKKQIEILFPKEELYCLAFSLDSRTLAVACGNRVVLWDVASGKEVRAWPEHQKAVRSVIFLPDGNTIAIVEEEDRVHFRDLRTGNSTQLLKAQKPKPHIQKDGMRVEEFHSPKLSPDGKVVAWSIRRMTFGEDTSIGEDDTTIKCCSVDSDKVRSSFAVLGDRPLVFDRTGKTLAEVRMTGADVWDAVTGKKQRTLEPKGFTLESVALSPDGKTLATGCNGNLLLLWDPRSGKLLHRVRLPIFPSGVSSDRVPLAFAADGRTLVAGYGGRVFLIHVASGKHTLPLATHERPVYQLRFSSDGKSLLSGQRIDAFVWDTRSWRQRKRWWPASLLADNQMVLAIAPDGNLLVHPDPPADDAQLLDAYSSESSSVYSQGRDGQAKPFFGERPIGSSLGP